MLVSVLESEAQLKFNRVILRKGQKIFLERGDYMKDKIYGITESSDTVQVVLADQAFYKFKKGDFEAWAITNQLNEANDIIANEAKENFPFMSVTDKVTSVYKEGKLGAERILDLKKGTSVTVKSKLSYFYEIEYGDGKIGYIVTTMIPGLERDRDKSHIMRSIFNQIRNGGAGGIDERYVRKNGKIISKYNSEGYSSESFKIGNTIYTITKINGRTEISSYVSY